MQLRIARLCLDCEEIHAEQQCPVCASEAFTFIKRWVPAPERRSRPRTENPADNKAYERLRSTEQQQQPVGSVQLVKRAAVGLAAASLAGWLWHWTTPRAAHPSASSAPPPPHPPEPRPSAGSETSG